LGYAVFELLRLCTQVFVGQFLKLRLQCIDARHYGAVLFEQAVIATAKDFGKNIDGHACKTGLLPPRVADQRSPFSLLGEMGAIG
jgi:hypothetical protein